MILFRPTRHVRLDVGFRPARGRERHGLALTGAAALALALAGCAGQDTSSQAPSAAATNAATACEYLPAGPAAKPADPPPSVASGQRDVEVRTNLGEFALTLDPERAPCTANSFTSLATQGYYDDTVCHRLTVSGIFVLQCGDPSATGSGGPGYAFADELDGSETYPAGTLAMANSGPNTNGSQFFIVYDDTQLPAAYTVFGSVDDSGLALAKQVAAAGLGPNGVAPATEVRLEALTVTD